MNRAARYLLKRSRWDGLCYSVLAGVCLVGAYFTGGVVWFTQYMSALYSGVDLQARPDLVGGVERLAALRILSVLLQLVLWIGFVPMVLFSITLEVARLIFGNDEDQTGKSQTP